MDPAALLDTFGLAPGELDLLIGGPPCQSFSTAGKRRTVQDHRGTLLWQFLRFVEVIRPRFFLMENVRGLLSAALRHRPIRKRPSHGGPPLEDDERPGSVIRQFADDLARLPDATYRMDCFEVNAVNYGAPQLRERALLVGNRYNEVVSFPAPTHGPPESGARDPGGLLFDDLSREPLLPWRTLRDATGNLSGEPEVLMDFSPRKKKYLAMVAPGSNWRSLPVAVQKESMGAVWSAKGGRSGWWRRLSLDLPCPTLVTMPNHAGTSLCHPTQLRALSLKEYQLIQEFPEDWEFCGSPAQQYAQAGNAVPVRLGEVAGQLVAERLDALRERRWQPYRTEADRYRIVYVQSHVRTRQWFKGGDVFVWSDGDENAKAKYGPPKTRLAVRSLSSR
jgi:DNA (cytosine-5)-methyltransferase 1